ncbi:MAG: ABC transporter ATP-binding protein/permease [Bacilli bacterium]|nr:ABC transporter ATP-binding protein/permease [Bacilli bacterium]
MIEIKNLHKYFNRHKKNELHVINDVSLKLPQKGLVALLGPSGSGKTTMLNLIGGLDKQNKGKVIINNDKISKKSFLKRDKLRTLNIGYIFQDYKLIDDDSVFDNVALSLKLLGVKNKKEIKRRVEFILEKVDMFRYRYRPAGMLSGGERQRVGIARALVKDPDIILADEPTGNLDSKNTLDVMNIITQIAKEKLVILVTHEQNLAKFYADRVIEFADGVITKDYKNEQPDELDYQVENKFYLKDFKHKNKINKDNAEINIYSNDKSNVKIDIVIRNGNYYIKTYNNFLTQLVDENSAVEFIDDKYKKMNKNDLEVKSFDAEDIKHKKYSSIFNVFSFIFKGFEKVFNYSFFKKLLLVGFLLSGGFILYAISSYTAAITIKDDMFITESRDYVTITTGKNNVDVYKKIKSLDENAFIIPGSATGKFYVKEDYLSQFFDYSLAFLGNLVPLDAVSKEDLIYGRLPENSSEIVVDKFLVKKKLTSPDYKMQGITSVKELLNKTLIMEISDKTYKIVGISNKNEPCIYIDKNDIIPIIQLGKLNEEESYDESQIIYSYSYNKDDLKIVKGREPVKDYEIVVNYNSRYEYPLNKKIDTQVNKNKLLVVGYYKSDYDINDIYASDSTIMYSIIPKTSNYSIFKGNINLYKENNYSASNSYELSKNKYIKDNKESVKSKLIVSSIIISISLVEAFLISRSSFLSKVKEVGTYRAIGVKRLDICKMFVGESFAITTLSSVPGIIFASYVLKKLSSIKYLKYMYIVNFKVIILSIIIVYVFNILVSLIPVLNLIRKTPANILSRNDVD